MLEGDSVERLSEMWGDRAFRRTAAVSGRGGIGGGVL